MRWNIGMVGGSRSSTSSGTAARVRNLCECVLFIATANDLAGTPAPLRDRLEVIEAPGYTDEEKVDIVRRNLWGAQLEAAGLTGGGFWTRPPGGDARRGPGRAAGHGGSRARRWVSRLFQSPIPPATASRS